MPFAGAKDVSHVDGEAAGGGGVPRRRRREERTGEAVLTPGAEITCHGRSDAADLGTGRWGGEEAERDARVLRRRRKVAGRRATLLIGDAGKRDGRIEYGTQAFQAPAVVRAEAAGRRGFFEDPPSADGIAVRASVDPRSTGGARRDPPARGAIAVDAGERCGAFTPSFVDGRGLRHGRQTPPARHGRRR